MRHLCATEIDMMRYKHLTFDKNMAVNPAR